MIKMVHNAILKHFLKAINIVLQVSTETVNEKDMLSSSDDVLWTREKQDWLAFWSVIDIMTSYLSL